MSLFVKRLISLTVFAKKKLFLPHENCVQEILPVFFPSYIMSLCFCVWLGFLSIKTSCLWSLVKFLFFSDFFGLFLHGPFLNTLSHIKIVLVCDTLFTKTFMNSTFFFYFTNAKRLKLQVYSQTK